MYRWHLNINDMSFFCLVYVYVCWKDIFFLFVRKFATLLRVAEEDGDHIYKLHYHMQPLSSGIVEDSEDSTILPMATSFKTEGLEGSCTIPLDSIAQIFVLGSKHTAWERMLMTLIYFDGVY